MTIQTTLLRKQGAPDVADLLRLVEQVTGTGHGARTRLAEMLGCQTATVRDWIAGRKAPSPAFLRRLREVERDLRARKPIEALAASASPVVERLPLMANVVSVKVEGDRALVRFGLAIPGEEESRLVAEVLVPRGALEKALGASLLVGQMSRSIEPSEQVVSMKLLNTVGSAR